MGSDQGDDRDTGDDEPPESDEGTLEVALIEARRSFDKDIQSINDVDEKAMRAGRTGFVVLGIVVSAVAIFGPESVGAFSIQVRILGGLGLLAVFSSTVFALGTYTSTEYPTGIGSEHREAALNDGDTRREWLEFMIEEYGDWNEEVAEMADANASYLDRTTTLQMTGLLSLSLAVTVGYLNRVEGIAPEITLSVLVIGTGLLSILNWARSPLGIAADTLLDSRE